MSTEHQQYSTENQAQTIREYAEQRDIKIIKTYSDDAKSGVIIGGRDALQQLIADVESGTAGFSVILVYDVTRLDLPGFCGERSAHFFGLSLERDRALEAER